MIGFFRRMPIVPQCRVLPLLRITCNRHRRGRRREATKSKSAQYRFLAEHRGELQALLDRHQFPARSTYFDRYRRAHRLFIQAIKRQGQRAVVEGIVDATDVAVDKSLVAARGPLWHKSDRTIKRSCSAPCSPTAY
jgi:hypothetical protein